MTKRLVVLGGGESGVGAAVLAKLQGWEVFVSDKNNIKDNYLEILNKYQIDFEELVHTKELILNATLVVKSPGIPSNIDLIKEIKELNIPVISEIEFAYRYQKGKIIGITGSNGKTTVSNLIYHLLQNNDFTVGLVGNVGFSFAYMVAINPKDVYVVELSSFQLDECVDFKCDVSILLNITPDHLDRYDYNFNNYIQSKFNITKHQTQDDWFIYNEDDIQILNYLNINKNTINALMIPFSIEKEIKKGGFIENNTIIINILEPILKMNTSNLTIKGKHNLYNSLAAGIAAKRFEFKNESLIEKFATFKNVPHRLENVLNIGGVLYINDSKATNVNSTWYALECQTKKCVLILGGVDKGNDYSVLYDLLRKKVKAIVCLGVNNIKLHSQLGDKVEVMINTDNMKDAVRAASKLASKNEVVLLSPACASFDLFQNYEDRGIQFKNCVRDL